PTPRNFDRPWPCGQHGGWVVGAYPMGRVARGVSTLALVFVSGIATMSAALADKAGDEKGTFSFVLENDVFYGLDRDYTNGIQFAWTTGPLDEKCWVCEPARVLPFFKGVGKI